jgi:hypothetical protein
MRAAALTAVVVLAAGCGGSPTTHATGSSAVAYSRCMRSNGVSSFPDPGSNGAVPKVGLQQLGVSSARFQSAASACRRLLPNGGQPPSAAQVQEVRALSLHFAQCVRAHGLPSFPDPDSSGRIPDPSTVGIDQGAPKFQAANTACARYRPPYMPSNAAYDAWARSSGG